MHEPLVDRIYEASVLPELWSGVIAQMTEAVEGQAALLSTIQANSAHIISTSEDFKETWEYIFRHFSGAANHRTQRLLAARHAGFLVDADVFGADEIRNDPLYTEVLIPRGYGSGVATAIHYPDGAAIIVNVERAAARGAFDAAAVGRLDGLRPHLARSALISARLSFERARTAVETLSGIGLAACAVTQAGAVLVANREFETGGPLWTTRGGDRVALADRRADRQLQEALGTTATGLGVRSLPLLAPEGGTPAVLHAVPIRRAAHDLFGRAAAILVLTQASSAPTQATSLLQALFDLSATEAGIAARIAAGQTAEQIALTDGKSVDTVRNQVKSVLQKTGCARQLDLARLLAQLIPPL
ncbi:helix-turn-helix transcriptional regulator [Mesorhizobium sp. LHD-90]|uniref:helix-turn-helix transcriptional regulator n=1 Tax=Mesorhizobium sp. LHD-90 TaxID=3071414 RepID=UPI0027DEAD16|nr:helix-turn-helix transcriptional regulator [Mesorhizobium sp. LHD-90]MDQ6432710.1 helix-turn-helix transcriptional regulator [Mesorhizobium sp. LHD-90]